MSDSALLAETLRVITLLAAGELGARIVLPDPFVEDDLTALAVGVNMLAEELQALTGGLEAAVDARTQQLQAVQEQLSYDAGHDHLTGLANRRLLHSRLEHHLVRRRSDSALLVLDLDGFKDINDSLGHSIGDAVLVAAASRLRTCLRPGDTVARLGGDEFAALLLGISDDSFELVAARLLSALRAPLSIEGYAVAMTASVGLVPLRTAATAEELLRLADLAMYRAKSEGKNRAHVYTQQLEEQAEQRRAVEHGLRTSLDAGAVPVVYQPIIDTLSLRLVGVEGLCRWPHADGPAFPPSVFIPVAEQTGMIQELGAAVLRQVCRDAVRWTELTGTVLRFAVNVSGEQLADPSFADLVLLTLTATGATAAMLTIEVTETVLMKHQQGVATLRRLREAGLEVAIDDFGTGYSSLSALRRLPVTTLKIDGSFISGLGSDEDDSTVVRAILGLARGLGLTVVAEGVETLSQQHELVQLACDKVQGYLHARPMSFAALLQWQQARSIERTGHP